MPANVLGNPYMTTFTTVVIVSAHGDTPDQTRGSRPADPLIKVNVFDYLHTFLRDFEISLTPQGNLWDKIRNQVDFRQWSKLIVNINEEKIECDILQTGKQMMQDILKLYDPKKEMSFELLLRDEEENILNKKIEVRVIGDWFGKNVKNFRIGLEDSQNIFDQIEHHVRKDYWKSLTLIGYSGTYLTFSENDDEYIKKLIFESYKKKKPLYILLHMNVDDLPSTEQDEAADGIQNEVNSGKYYPSTVGMNIPKYPQANNEETLPETPSPRQYYPRTVGMNVPTYHKPKNEETLPETRLLPKYRPSTVGMNVQTYKQANNVSSYSLLPQQLTLASGLCIPAPAPWR